MIKFLAGRLLSATAMAVVVSGVTFLLLFANGEAIARAQLGPEASPATVTARAHELGLDQPGLVRYWDWLSTLVTGDGLGTSFYTNAEVADMVGPRLQVTLSIVGIAMILTAILSVGVGVIAAVRGGWIDRGLQTVSAIGVAVPSFIIAIILVLVFAVNLDLLPATGYVRPEMGGVGPWLVSLTLPVLAVVIHSVGSTAQQFRGAVRDTLNQDFVRTLRARGIPNWIVILRHVLRNAAGPGLTSLGLQVVGLIGGVVVIEFVFALPGIGSLTLSSALRGDIPVVMGCVVFIIVVVTFVNLVADLVNGWLNPKARTT